jgi:TonB family protein
MINRKNACLIVLLIHVTLLSSLVKADNNQSGTMAYIYPVDTFSVGEYTVVTYAQKNEDQNIPTRYEFIIIKENSQCGTIFLKKQTPSGYLLGIEYFNDSKLEHGSQFLKTQKGHGTLVLYREPPLYIYLQHLIVTHLLHLNRLEYSHYITPDDTVTVYFYGNGEWSLGIQPDVQTIILPSCITLEQDLRIILAKDGTWNFLFADDTIPMDIGDSLFTVDHVPQPDTVPFQELEVKPQPITIPTPIYPEIARKGGIEGDVVTHALVELDGSISGAYILKTSGHEYLDLAALQASLEATFTSAQYNGRKVRVWVSIPIRFKLH